jgi:mRNA-degrading endonuclease toxin of MazEF toxin-antitoxin module
MKLSNTLGTEQQKDRPYIIVSRNSVNDLGEAVVGIPLSKQIHKASAYRIVLPVNEIIKEPGYNRPLFDGVALTDHIRVLDVSRLMQKMGRLSDSATISVSLGLSFLLDIT